jgi:MoxR-like ATPase
MMKLRIDYPRREEEREILERVALAPVNASTARAVDEVVTASSASADAILEARTELDAIRVDRRIQDYIVSLVFATREPAEAGLPEFEKLLEFGTSPRATIFLTRAARARAFLEGRDFVLPDDVKAIAHPVLRHRLRTTYEADAKGIDSDQLVDRLLATVPSP